MHAPRVLVQVELRELKLEQKKNGLSVQYVSGSAKSVRLNPLRPTYTHLSAQLLPSSQRTQTRHLPVSPITRFSLPEVGQGFMTVCPLQFDGAIFFACLHYKQTLSVLSHPTSPENADGHSIVQNYPFDRESRQFQSFHAFQIDVRTLGCFQL